MRNAVMWAMVVTFFLLGLFDIKDGQYRTGVASLLLGVVQLLVFWRTHNGGDIGC